ncbi:hypothetical protein LA66_13860 [Aureimonas altamirensis]|uniref:DUF982 domain-containing protein n=1 Tax=Aureimonas altamirensis TaxID=370622 RepID=A0A0B1Q6H9_9HYPH|nr:DUF982 domain-containing protein [Aureimonas altamirensis]KHJ54517.1 hypothetical protein LA66_13860 [Aureimonas altamirensis]
MTVGNFREPVTVLVGIGVPVAVSDVRHALELMIDWPHRSRRTGHFACIDTCRQALNGRCDTETAREAFMSFAESAGILMPPLNDAILAGQSTPVAGNAARA